jgi:hypothetical protein
MLMRVSGRWRLAACCLALEALGPGPVVAQQAAPAAPQPAAAPAADEAAEFSTEQLDALLAPIALYPDALLAQILMASTYPLQVVDAARWVADPAHKGLTGDALTTALNPLSWDPSVKSLVPFPQVLETMNSKLDWMQQVGYAFATQQAQVWDSVQRLRRQAQAAGTLQSTPQQVVRNEVAAVTYEPAPAGATGAALPPQGVPAQAENIVIEPAQADTVFVPSYDPATAFGTWPYPEYPPVALPPPPGYGYGLGTALATGLLFGAGVAVTASLWNWARPSWGRGYTNVNVNRFNQINYNRRPINNAVWRPSAASGGWHRPPTGPVGRPVRGNGLPAGAIGRQHVSVPSSLVNRPVNGGNFNNNNVAINRPGGGGQGIANRPGGGEGIANRPGGGQGIANRPGGGQGIANRPGGGQGVANRPGGGQGIANRPGGGQGVANRPGSGQGVANRPGGGQGIANRPGGGQGIANRPAGGQGIANRPSGGQGIANRPGGGQAIANRPGNGAAQRPAIQRPAAPARQPAAFAGARDGQRASQFAARGGQSRSFNQAQRPAGGFQRGGGGGGGGGGFRGGGGGGHAGGGGGHRGRH